MEQDTHGTLHPSSCDGATYTKVAVSNLIKNPVTKVMARAALAHDI
jgi:hypothetical protein